MTVDAFYNYHDREILEWLDSPNPEPISLQPGFEIASSTCFKLFTWSRSSLIFLLWTSRRRIESVRWSSDNRALRTSVCSNRITSNFLRTRLLWLSVRSIGAAYSEWNFNIAGKVEKLYRCFHNELQIHCPRSQVELLIPCKHVDSASSIHKIITIVKRTKTINVRTENIIDGQTHLEPDSSVYSIVVEYKQL